jgi:hypothetical protein
MRNIPPQRTQRDTEKKNDFIPPCSSVSSVVKLSAVPLAIIE